MIKNPTLKVLVIALAIALLMTAVTAVAQNIKLRTLCDIAARAEICIYELYDFSDPAATPYTAPDGTIYDGYAYLDIDGLSFIIGVHVG